MKEHKNPVPSFIQPKRQVVNTYFVPDPILGSRNTAMDKLQHPSLRGQQFSRRYSNCTIELSIFSTEIILSTVDVPLTNFHLSNSGLFDVLHSQPLISGFPNTKSSILLVNGYFSQWNCVLTNTQLCVSPNMSISIVLVTALTQFN